MKTINIFAISILLSLSNVSLAKSLRLGGTSGVGGGGTSVAAEFVFVGKTALSILSTEGVLSPDLASVIIQQTSVFDVGNLCSIEPNTGSIYCLDAKYNPNLNAISFDRNKWNDKTCAAKFVLAAHEYLRAAGLENSDYNFSSEFYSGKHASEIQAVCNELSVARNVK